MLKRKLQSTAAFWKKFSHSETGSVAIMFAGTVLALLAASGLAYDGAMVHKTKLELQNTVDAAALSVAKSQPNTAAGLERIASEHLDTNMTMGQITLDSATRIGDSYTVEASVPYRTSFMRIFGTDVVDVKAVGTTTYDVQEFSLALVLDTTGSMRGTKIASLKTAANGLIDNLEGMGSDAVKVSVVPFGQYVNVGLSRRYAPWLDVPADGSTTGERVCRMTSDVISRSNCRTVARTCTDDGLSYACNRRVCDVERGPQYETCSTPVTNVVWNGCVGSRNTPYNTQAAYNGRRIPGLTNVSCGSEILPLTDNLTRVKQSISNLSTNGETYLPSGIVWGWRALQEDMPLTEIASASTANVQKHMIIMTDGANTKSKNGDKHTGNSAANANATTRSLCQNAKDDGITVYTISYDVTDAATRALMTQCATSDSTAYQADDSAELTRAFNEISQTLVTLRLTN